MYSSKLLSNFVTKVFDHFPQIFSNFFHSKQTNFLLSSIVDNDLDVTSVFNCR